ncbi:translocator protein-like [Aricia agestis]|uniref:translocator protein-like n=1 Tax=Aricia agestis TaxID=91739 RepID=UPI001C207CDD|nr:translocator protein-like [Aricia agestis]XP_041985435.1 translocator protein-like [Aricia agestis]XP_041985436.1 translocator protein-like [Aricia agestis]
MINWNLIGSMILPNVGGWAGAITMAGQVKNANGTAWYQTINKPSWNPPNWIFGPAWTVLYCGMGFASYMVWRDCGGFTNKSILPLTLYGGQLVINWMWTPVFFRLHQIGLALIHIIALDAAAAACTASFIAVNKNTVYFMVPYLAWLSFATALNYSIWQLNKDDGEKNK